MTIAVTSGLPTLAHNINEVMPGVCITVSIGNPCEKMVYNGATLFYSIALKMTTFALSRASGDGSSVVYSTILFLMRKNLIIKPSN